MQVTPKRFFDFCSSHVPLLHAIAVKPGDVSEAQVRQLLAVDNQRLRFFAADLNHDAGWAEAMAGCTHAAHLASPLPRGVPIGEPLPRCSSP